MYSEINDAIQKGFLNGFLITAKTLWPYFLCLLILAIIMVYIEALLHKRNHEKTWKTKHIVNLLEEIKNNTSSNNN